MKEFLPFYRLYRSLLYTLNPFIKYYFLHFSKKYKDTETKLLEKFGISSINRPEGYLVWFHAVSVGENAAALPIIQRCLQNKPTVNILLTTHNALARTMMENYFGDEVIYQYAPLDTPQSVDNFFLFWKPNFVVFLESEFWPNLFLSEHMKNLPVVLLNGRISNKSFERWNCSISKNTISSILSKFQFVTCPNSTEAIKLQILGLNPLKINFLGDLKFATVPLVSNSNKFPSVDEIKIQIQNRNVWIASSTHAEEESIIINIHAKLVKIFPNLLTIISPRHPLRMKLIAKVLKERRISFACRSANEEVNEKTSIYISDTIGELSSIYRLSSISFVGGSLFPHLKGHNFSEAAAAGCAVITGLYIGHFSSMAAQLQKISPLSIVQIKDATELEEVVKELLENEKERTSRAESARYAATLASKNIADSVWHKVNELMDLRG